MADSPLSVEGASWKPPRGPFRLGPVDARLEEGRFTALVGPNGCGKSSLLALAAGLETPDAGTLRVYGRPPAAMRARERGRILSLLAQDPERPFGFTVAEYVGLGRYPHLGPFRSPGADDRAAVAAELDGLGLTALAGRSVRTLSGGELQRVRLARALAQRTRLLLLDEPGNHLDLAHRAGILERLRAESRSGRTVLAVLHDVNDALLYADAVWLMKAGRVTACGTPGAVLEESALRDAYGLELTRFRDEEGREMLGPAPSTSSRD